MELTSTIPKHFSWIGKLIKIKHAHKRTWGIVTNSVNGVQQENWEDWEMGTPITTLTIKPVYRPAPKSQLLNRSVFSKFKKKIIPLNPIKTS